MAFVSLYDSANHRLADQYDRDGRLLQTSETRYVYNAAAQLLQVYSRVPADASAMYAYDAYGDRQAAVANDAVVYTARLPQGPILEQVRYAPDATGCVSKSVTDFAYFNGSAVLQWTTARNKTSARQYLLRDTSGTLAAVVDERDPTHPTYPHYGPFGEPLSAEPAEAVHQYQGHQRDSATGLDAMRARHYSPRRGQFLVPDPALQMDLTLPISLNPYAFARNNPSAFIDPDGQDWVRNADGEMQWEGSDAVESVSSPLDFVLMSSRGARLALDMAEKSGVADAIRQGARTSTDKLKNLFGLTRVGFDKTVLLPGNKSKGLRHILKKHSYETHPSRKSYFLEEMGPKEIRELIEDSLRGKVTWQKHDGYFRVDVRLKHVVGIDVNGRASSMLRIVANKKGEIVSAYPL
jgi:RHS repeat-associated protein